MGEEHHTAWVVDGWLGMEQCWNDTDRANLKYWEKNLSKLHFVQQIFYIF